MASIKPPEFWMDSKQYASLSATDKHAISAAIETYENAVAAAEKDLTDAIAVITDGKVSITTDDPK